MTDIETGIRCHFCLRPVQRLTTGRSGATSLVPDDPNPEFCLMNDGKLQGSPNLSVPRNIHMICCASRSNGKDSAPIGGHGHTGKCSNRHRPHPDIEYFQGLDRYLEPSIEHIESCIHLLEQWVTA